MKGKSELVKALIKKSGLSYKGMARRMNISSAQCLNSKLFRNSFTFEELIMAAFPAGFIFVLMPTDGDDESIPIYPKDFLGEDSDEWKVISDFSLQDREKAFDEYNDLKAKIKELKDKYGFKN